MDISVVNQLDPISTSTILGNVNIVFLYCDILRILHRSYGKIQVLHLFVVVVELRLHLSSLAIHNLHFANIFCLWRSGCRLLVWIQIVVPVSPVSPDRVDVGVAPIHILQNKRL